MNDDYIKGQIETLKDCIKDLEERVEEYEFEIMASGHPAIYNRMAECQDWISRLRNKVYEISPADCDW